MYVVNPRKEDPAFQAKSDEESVNEQPTTEHLLSQKTKKKKLK
jgi:hypothetical protein